MKIHLKCAIIIQGQLIGGRMVGLGELAVGEVFKIPTFWSTSKDEKEVLFPIGAKFEIEDVREIGEKVFIRVVEI